MIFLARIRAKAQSFRWLIHPSGLVGSQTISFTQTFSHTWTSPNPPQAPEWIMSMRVVADAIENSAIEICTGKPQVGLARFINGGDSPQTSILGTVQIVDVEQGRKTSVSPVLWELV